MVESDRPVAHRQVSTAGRLRLTIISNMLRLARWALGSDSAILDVLKGEIAQGAAASLSLRILGAGFGMVLSAFLARILGTQGYGTYIFAMTCVGILAAPSMLGLDGLLVREVSIYQTRSEWGLLHGILRRSVQAVLISSATMASLAALFAWQLKIHLEPGLLGPLYVGLLALPILTLVRVRQMAMMGMRRVVTAQIPDGIVAPLVVGAAAVAIVILVDERPTPAMIASTHLLALLAAWPISELFLRRIISTQAKPAIRVYRTKTWAQDAWIFCLTTSIELLGSGAGVILLAVMKGGEAAGIFAVATMLAGAIAMPLAAMRIPLAPVVARVFAAGDRSELQQLATKTARCSLLLGAPVFLLYLLLGRWILGIFGADFTAGYSALIILCIGQVVNIAFGAVGVLLQMTGRERVVVGGLGLSTTLSLGLGIGLIPFWGIEGAAVAVSCAMITWNVVLGASVHKWLGAWPTAFGSVRQVT